MLESLSARARESVFGFVLIPCLVACSGKESGAAADAGNGPAVFRQVCGRCHLPPNVRAHRADEWPRVVARMQQHMATQGKAPLTAEQRAGILDYLTGHALEAP